MPLTFKSRGHLFKNSKVNDCVNQEEQLLDTEMQKIPLAILTFVS